MRSSEIQYKLLIFLLINFVVGIILFKFISTFFYYKTDFYFFKEKFKSITNKQYGTFYNNLNNDIIAFIDVKYLKDNNLDFLFPIKYDTETLDGIDLSLDKYSIAFSINNQISKLPIGIGIKKVDDYIVLNNKYFLSRYLETQNLPENYLSYQVYYLLNNKLSLSTIEKIKPDNEAPYFDNSINLRIINYNGYPLFSTLLMKKNEKVAFYFDPDLAIRIFYNPNEFSLDFIKSFLENLKQISSGEIKGTLLSTLFKKDSFYIKLNDKELYELKDLDLNLNKDVCLSRVKEGIIIYFLAIYKIRDKELVSKFCDNLDYSNFQLENRKLQIFLNIKDKVLERRLYSYLNKYTPYLVLGSDNLPKIINTLNYCKFNKKTNLKDCSNELYLLSKNLPTIEFRFLKPFLNVQNLSKTYKELEKENIVYNFKDFKKYLDYLIIFKNLNPVYLCKKDKKECRLKIYDFYTNKEEEIKVNNSLTTFLLNKQEEINKYLSKEDLKDAFISIREVIDKVYSNDEAQDLWKQFEFINNIKFDLALMKNKINGYLNDKNLIIYPTNKLYFLPSLVFNIEKIKRENNKWKLVYS